MKLSKIYANNQNFKTILFNEGFNIIFGNIEDEESKNVQEHNLGKTSLVYLIDFMLLKGVKKDNFFGKYKKNFFDWIFFLEIKLNNGEYLTIRRSVNKHTKISFKKHFSSNQNYLNEENWDYLNLSVSSKKLEINPKHILNNEYFKFNVNSNYNYRKFSPFLLRTQSDYLEVFRLNSFNRGKDKEWKPSLFNLLGFDPSFLIEKYSLDEESTAEKSYKKKLEKNQDYDNEIYKIKAAIEAKNIDKKSLQLELDNFNFFQKEKNINFDLVKNIEYKISLLNKENYLLVHNINKLKKSLDSSKSPSIQINEIKKMFEEVQIFFPNDLIKDYEDVIDFSEQVTKERKKYLKEELNELQEQEQIVNEELKGLNSKRMACLSFLKEKDSFKKFKKYQEELIKIESEILVYNQRLESAKTIESCQDSIDEIQNKIKELSINLKEEVDKDNLDYLEIKKIFQNIYKKTFEYTALLIVEPNTKGNINFETSVLNISQDLTGKGDGHTSTKILCASFVLSILIHYSSQSFFKFAFHDGILESWGDSPKKNFISLIRKYCKDYDIQYVISIIKSDLPKDFKINEGEIVSTLSKGDELFGFDF